MYVYIYIYIISNILNINLSLSLSLCIHIYIYIHIHIYTYTFPNMTYLTWASSEVTFLINKTERDTLYYRIRQYAYNRPE